MSDWVARGPAPERLQGYQKRLFKELEPELALGDLDEKTRQVFELAGQLLDLEHLFVSFQRHFVVCNLAIAVGHFQLNFVTALALGPVIELLMMIGG